VSSDQADPEVSGYLSLIRAAYEAGRAEADGDIAAGLLGQNQEHRAHLAAAQERAAYGPGGREHFADPRPGDFPGRAKEPQREAGD
jgi:hypothetical protein